MDKSEKLPLCENCGRPLKGRSDKRFCDDNCRNTFNHKQRIPDNEVVNPVINILKKNRTILSQAYLAGSRTLSKMQLLQLGFNFHFCTDRRTLSGSEYYFTFDFGFEITGNDQYSIISTDYFDYIHADYLNSLPKLVASDPADEIEVAYFKTLREPLYINSELIPVPEPKKTNPNLRVSE